MIKPTQQIDLTTASTCAIAAGTASDYAARASSPEVAKALEKLSLRFAEIALEALGGEPGKHDESAGV